MNHQNKILYGFLNHVGQLIPLPTIWLAEDLFKPPPEVIHVFDEGSELSKVCEAFARAGDLGRVSLVRLDQVKDGRPPRTLTFEWEAHLNGDGVTFSHQGWRIGDRRVKRRGWVKIKVPTRLSP